ENDSLSDGSSIVDLTDITLDLDPATAGIQDTLIVAGEGVYVYDTLTGEVTFTPEVGFTTDPTPIVYNLIEDATGLDSTATITITYLEVNPPIAEDDSRFDVPVGLEVTLNIVGNDSLGNINNIIIDLNPGVPGIQDSLIVDGEGIYVYDTITGSVTFTPEDDFYGQPTPVTYELIDGETGLSDDAIITITYQDIDMKLSKSVSNSSPMVGEVVTYSITVSNASADTVNNISVVDYLPNGLINIDSISGGGVVSGDSIIWTNFTLANGQDSVLTFNAEIAASTDSVVYENFAEITTANGYDDNSEPSNLDGPPAEDDEDAACVFVDQFETIYNYCTGDSIRLQPVGINAVNWTYESDSVSLSRSSLIMNALTQADSGNYLITYTGASGCTFTEDVLLRYQGKPSAIITPVPAECNGGSTLDNGHIIVVPTSGAVTYQISEGTSFDEAMATSLTPQAIPSDGVVIRDLANQVGGRTFTVRLFNSNGCSEDFVTLVPEANCSCPVEVCVPIIFKKTKSLN
ncbi:hypothetical protein, partial [uncultured Arcticibacterium sp.]|uniref:hypothetical protein n=1 Tax=uncultured Arcticibacterium sp. TaxID=2173042 RepID=UPI0030FBEDC6